MLRSQTYDFRQQKLLSRLWQLQAQSWTGFLKVNIRDFLEKWRWYQWNPSNYGTSSTSKKGNFYILLPKLASTLFGPFHTISREKPTGWDPKSRVVSQNTTGEVLPSIGTTWPRHIVKMPHDPPGWCIFTGASREDPSWMVFFTNQMEILRHVGNLINHLILHPHPIYEQSISTNSFPASNTA